MAPDPAAVPPERAELLWPLWALASLLSKDGDESSNKAIPLALGLDEHEVQEVHEFALAGQRCLAKLSGAVIKDLSGLNQGRKAFSRSTSRNSNSGKKGEVSHDVLQLFDKFDSDRSGVLTYDEFRISFNKLTNGKFTKPEVEKMIEAADVNKDGVIDIHEFAVWLYGKKSAPPKGVDVEKLKEKLEKAELELQVKTKALQQIESEHEAEMEATHDFWKGIAKHAVLNIDSKVDLGKADWLGNGKYGFVLKARRRSDDRELVVKMMGIRWAHLAVKEWQAGSVVGSHPNIVEYEEVMLHADNDASIQGMIKAGYDAGELKSRTKRSKFPDRYICLTQEFMNRGTVQDWMDKNMLLPGGIFVTLQLVAKALAYMHSNGSTHNDIKPENIMLHQEMSKNEVLVKLGDLGLAEKSKDTTKDYWQTGMTAFCMITGAKFGSRKYLKESEPEFVEEMAAAAKSFKQGGKIADTLKELPVLTKDLFTQELTFSKLSAWPSLQGWSYFDGDVGEDGIPNRSVSFMEGLAGKDAMRHMGAAA